MKYIVIFFAVCVSVITTHAATINADSPSRADVLTAYNAASAGDTIVIPLGTNSWTDSIAIGKALTIQGSGTNTSSRTLILNAQSASQGLESPVFDVTTENGPIWIKDIYFQDSSNNDDSDGIRVEALTRAFRVSSCVFERFSFGFKNNSGFGLVDHCIFLNNDVGVRNAGWNTVAGIPMAGAPWGWNSTNYMVFEDCIFQHQSWAEDTYHGDTEYPANYIIRYCSFVDNKSSAVGIDGWDMHGTTSGSAVVPLGALIYKNTWSFSGNTTVNPFRLADIRGGANSLVYSNTVSTLSSYIEMRADPGTALMTNTYVWNNTDAGGGADVSGSDGVTLNTHYFTSQPGAFTQLEYPHPLIGALEENDPPTNFRVLGGKVNIRGKATL